MNWKILELARSIRDDEFLKILANDSDRAIVYIFEEKPTEYKFGPSIEILNLPRKLIEYLRSKGIERLYDFQWIAYQKVLEGKNVVIISGTGSGKTEAFILPLIKKVYDENSKALILYPTKALARDQYLRIKQYLQVIGLEIEVYDGDTPSEIRKRIYEKPPHFLISNPDMLHYALMYVDKFKEIVRDIDYIVLDDFHIYEGVFGVHVHYILRRLQRFNKNLQFILTTATIGNPDEFAKQIIGKEIDVVYGFTGRKGLVRHVLIKPIRRSKLIETAKIVEECLKFNKKCLVFADSHKIVEYIKKILDKYGYSRIVKVHRAGLTADERRKIEDGFRKGEIKALITTPTLELGIDIGDVDVAIMATIPPSFNKYLQRSGRVGRRGQISYVIQILSNDPISTYFENNPEDFYNRKPESIILDLQNDEITKVHLLAMTIDKLVKVSELNDFELELMNKLVELGLVNKVGSYFKPNERTYKFLKDIPGLRGGIDQIKIIHNGSCIGFRELPIAIKELHDEAIYLHGGQVFKVEHLDLTLRLAYVKKLPNDYEFITTPLYESTPKIVKVIEKRKAYNIPVLYCDLIIKECVYGYVVKKFLTNDMIAEKYLDRRIEYEFKTKGIVIFMPLIKFSGIEVLDYLERAKAYHAVEHALIYASQIGLGVGQTDVGGISYPTGHIIIYDAYLGGSGISKQIFYNLERIIGIAYKIVSRCTCFDGCPKCIYSPYCGNNNKYLSRRNAIKVFQSVLKGISSIESEIPVNIKAIV